MTFLKISPAKTGRAWAITLLVINVKSNVVQKVYSRVIAVVGYFSGNTCQMLNLMQWNPWGVITKNSLDRGVNRVLRRAWRRCSSKRKQAVNFAVIIPRDITGGSPVGGLKLWIQTVIGSSGSRKPLVDNHIMASGVYKLAESFSGIYPDISVDINLPKLILYYLGNVPSNLEIHCQYGGVEAVRVTGFSH